MKIFAGADHAGYRLKEFLVAKLAAAGHAVEDLGVHDETRADYPDYAAAVARKVAAEPGGRGLLVCGSGIGMAIAANKIPGARAAVIHDGETARLSRRHNDANIAAIGARLTAEAAAWAALREFLAAEFEGGRHAARVEKIGALEKNR